MRRPKQLNYIQKKLIDINYHIYGSAKYLEQSKKKKKVSDLSKHRFISYGRGAPSPVFNPDWALKLGLKEGKKIKPVMKVNSVYGLLLAVQSGVGLAALPDYMTVSIPNLIRVLPSIEGPKTDAHFVYPQSLKNVARLVTFPVSFPPSDAVLDFTFPLIIELECVSISSALISPLIFASTIILSFSTKLPSMETSDNSIDDFSSLIKFIYN